MGKIKRKAFTLIEIMLTVAVIAVLSGMIYLTVGPSEEKANKTACFGEMAKLKTQYAFDAMESSDSFQTRIQTEMAGVPQVKNLNVGAASATFSGLCESGGTYTVTSKDTTITVTCSVHGSN